MPVDWMESWLASVREEPDPLSWPLSTERSSNSYHQISEHFSNHKVLPGCRCRFKIEPIAITIPWVPSTLFKTFKESSIVDKLRSTWARRVYQSSVLPRRAWVGLNRSKSRAAKKASQPRVCSPSFISRWLSDSACQLLFPFIVPPWVARNRYEHYEAVEPLPVKKVCSASTSQKS